MCVSPCRLFSTSKLVSRSRAYFGCIITLGALFAKGLQKFYHSKSGAYYQCLLQAERPNDIDPSLDAEKHEEMAKTLAPARMDPTVRTVGDDGLIFSDHEGSVKEDDVGARPRRGRKRARAPSAVGSEIGSGGGSEREEDSEHESVAAEPSDEPQPDSEVSVDEESVHAIVLPPLFLPCVVGGFRFESVWNFDKPGIKVMCPAHHACSKVRGLGERQTARHGDWESVAFGVAWARLGPEGAYPTANAHLHCPPISQEAVDAVYAEMVAGALVPARVDA